LSRPGVKADIFPQKLKREGVAPVVFWHGLTPHSRVSLWPCGKLPGTTEANVVVRIRRRIVQIQREHTGVGTIVPIAAA